MRTISAMNSPNTIVDLDREAVRVSIDIVNRVTSSDLDATRPARAGPSPPYLPT